MKLKPKDEKYYLKCILFDLMELGCIYIFLPIPCIYIIGAMSGSKLLVNTAIILSSLLILYIIFAILSYRKEKYSTFFSIISAITFLTLISHLGYLLITDADIIWKIALVSRAFIFLVYTVTLILTVKRLEAHITFNAIFGTILIMFSFNPIEILAGITHLVQIHKYSKLIEDSSEEHEN